MDGFTDQRTVEFSAKIPLTLYEEFSGYFPQHGANTWFIRTSLRALLNELKSQPDAIQRIRDAIQTTIKTA